MPIAPEQPLETLVLELDSFRFDAIACGPGEGPLVLFLHGFPAFADCWTAIMRAVGVQGYRCVAVDQRGYSPGARPLEVSDYLGRHLVADALGFARQLAGHRHHGTRFHVVGHDFGGFVAWMLGAHHADRLLSLTVLSTPHPAAFTRARIDDPDQKKKSEYIDVFRRRDHYAESRLLSDGAAMLRRLYAGVLPAAVEDRNVARLSASGALTAALNWYRALERGSEADTVGVPTLYVWSTQDAALGPVAAHATGRYVTGPYRFEILNNRSHWLPDEACDDVVPLLLQHLADHG